jgi:recombination DNA repair RAD52 pathway protein
MIPSEVKEKLVWASLLQPGDMVKDCCADIRTIKKIEPVKNKLEQVVDYNLFFANGMHCSAMHCCDQIREE